MTELPYTKDNIDLVQTFLDETKNRLANGVTITFTHKASSELEMLALDYNLDEDDIENAIRNLTVDNYYRGIDPSGNADFDVCAFSTQIGDESIDVYLKYGLEASGLQILMFSNHKPNYPMSQPFKN